MVSVRYCWIFILCYHTASRSVLASISEDCLEQHNLYRSLHQVPDVAYSSELEKKAQSLAVFMVKSETQLEYIQGIINENLFHDTSSVPLTISDAVQHWYESGQFYNYQRPNLGFQRMNFIQLVWKSYKRIGCGHAVANKKDGTVATYIVTLYEPPVHLPLTREELLSNVLAPKPKQ